MVRVILAYSITRPGDTLTTEHRPLPTKTTISPQNEGGDFELILSKKIRKGHCKTTEYGNEIKDRISINDVINLKDRGYEITLRAGKVYAKYNGR